MKLNYKDCAGVALLGFLVLFAPLFSRSAQAQGSICGQTKVHLSHPSYLTTPNYTIAIETPQGWALDEEHDGVFYIVKVGDNFKTARTLMYINVQRLSGSLAAAVESDEKSFRDGCHPSRIVDLAQPELLESACERKAQEFHCERQASPYVDRATKISVGGLLVNVVLSSDNETQIHRYESDYAFLLKHLALVK